MKWSKENWFKPWTSEISKCPRESFKLAGSYFNIHRESALGPLRKVLELLKSFNFAFGRFLSSVEKFGEKQTWTSAQFKLNWISEFFLNPQMFRSFHFKILWALDQTTINKVVSLTLMYKVYFDQNLSVVKNSSKKSNWKSSKWST